VFNSLEKMEYEALLKFVNKFLILLIGMALLLSGYKIKGVLVGLNFAYFLSISLGVYLVIKNVSNIKLKISISFWRAIVKQSIPLALTSVFVILFFRIDIVMLSWLGRPDSEIGWYSASIRLIDIIGVVPFLIMGGIFPVLSDLFKNDKNSFFSLYKKTFRALLIMGMTVGVGGYLLSKYVIFILYGKEFLKTISVFKIHLGLVPFIYLNYLFSNVLTSMERQKRVAINTGLCVPMNILLNLFLIPKYNYLGAGIATLITQIFLFVVNFMSVKR